MIDYVSLYTQINIPKGNFSPLTWALIHGEKGSFFFKKIRTVKIKYHIETQRFLITGKLINLFYDTQVLNVDDIYGRDIERFTKEVNEYLSRLTGVKIDINTFTVARVDYCFNVETPFVQTYLDVLNGAFKTVDTGKRMNFSAENKTPGSVYIKTTSDYRKNTRTNYTLNFYNKAEWIENQREQGGWISKEDDGFAKNVLRLEVQVSYTLLKAICKKHRMERIFRNFFAYEMAFETICTVYSRIFHCDMQHDFYTYKTAKQIISNRKARAVLELAAEHHTVSTSKYSYAVSLIKNKGIFPYAFISAKAEVDYLPNPLKLIQDKISTQIS